jgi:hypothetical protein
VREKVDGAGPDGKRCGQCAFQRVKRAPCSLIQPSAKVPNNQCFLATLGDTQQLQASTYQQIRLILADNSATVVSNACGSSANCVVVSSDNSVHQLLLSSESKTGLKVPSAQIASGSFTIATGQTKDLDIDFNTCASILPFFKRAMANTD